MNSTFKKIIAVACVLLLQPVLNPGSFAHARKRSPPKAFSFIAEGGKASQGECDGERKIPRLKRIKEFNKYSSYMGSELQDPELKGKIEGEMWKHFFRAKASCNSVLAKTPSSLEEEKKKTPKVELPPDDEADDDAPHAASEDADADTEGKSDAP
ncbi:hypothetical protein AZI86_00375 [Bdellovibrio bacteriovorus]|uniref:Uncharacterized protein n=1 Tax=Bdellovibrio bacteriovorus TaxID=959 RepID=A0A150WM53_BDEBC|nr:hypothetical protein [Bdellovibrio bacteriovorus]KYG65571.1 hypothetical protein AZI86_00375 [Bdellovibrio bacteriovorus]